MNNVVLLGNLVRDPEVREVTTNGKTTYVANFTLAVNRYFKKANDEKGKDTTFVPCEAWDSGAKTLGEFYKKGDQLLVNGSLKSESWEKDGQKHQRLKLRLNSFQKLRSAGERDNKDAPAASNDGGELVGAGNAEGNDLPF